MSDAKGPEEHIRSQFLSRSLAAYSLVKEAGISEAEAAAHVVDGFQDDGIDAAYFEPDESVMYLVQAKWFREGQGTPALGDVLKFTAGIRDLIVEADSSKFNAKMQKIWPSLFAALNTAVTTFKFIVIHTGVQALSQECRGRLDELIDELNDTNPVASYAVHNQGEIHASISGGLDRPISLDVMLNEWGHLREPYQAFYGQVNAEEVAQWYKSHGDRLFRKNLRKLIGKSEINKFISDTAVENPEQFWYFNNGITVLCQDVRKKPLGGGTNESGVFECVGVSVVNGAQTVGSIADAYQRSPDTVKKARVHVRFISVAGGPEEFATSVTRATNTQNRIENRDFAALDTNQERLRRELLMEGVEYAYKTGERVIAPDKGFSIDDATVALACQSEDSNLAVMAKSSIGKLWTDITKPPYSLLFNDHVSGTFLWKIVQVHRVVESELNSIQQTESGRGRLTCVHGDRFTLHVVFDAIRKSGHSMLDLELPRDSEAIRRLTRDAFSAITIAVQSVFPNSMLHSLFKNQSKCKTLVTRRSFLALKFEVPSASRKDGPRAAKRSRQQGEPA